MNTNLDDATSPSAEPSTINLDDYLKACGIALTGGQAKLMIQSGRVTLNGEVETRRRKKLIPGDVLTVDGNRILIEEE